MRKPSVGIIIFGIVFVLCGLRCLSGAVAYFAYREITPYIYKALEAKSNELEKLLQEKESTQGAKVIQAQKQLQTIKQDIQRYRERYVKGKMAPWSTLIFVIISFVAAGIFCYTGIAIIQLRVFARKLISISFLAGLIWIIALFWSASASAAYITKFTERFVALFASLNNTTPALPLYDSSVKNILLSVFGKRIIFICAAIYLTFMAITSIFFSRPKIKEQFK